MAEELSTDELERIKAHIRARIMTFEVFLPEELANGLRLRCYGVETIQGWNE